MVGLTIGYWTGVFCGPNCMTVMCVYVYMCVVSTYLCMQFVQYYIICVYIIILMYVRTKSYSMYIIYKYIFL